MSNGPLTSTDGAHVVPWLVQTAILGWPSRSLNPKYIVPLAPTPIDGSPLPYRRLCMSLIVCTVQVAPLFVETAKPGWQLGPAVLVTISHSGEPHALLGTYTVPSLGATFT